MAHKHLRVPWELSRQPLLPPSDRLLPPDQLQRLVRTPAPPCLPPLAQLSTVLVARRGGTTSLGLVHLKMRKVGCRRGGKGEKTTSAGHTTWIITHDKRHGLGLPQTTMLGSRGRRWNSNSQRRGRATKPGCCQRIGPAPTLQRCPTARTLRHKLQMHRARPMQRRW